MHDVTVRSLFRFVCLLSLSYRNTDSLRQSDGAIFLPRLSAILHSGAGWTLSRSLALTQASFTKLFQCTIDAAKLLYKVNLKVTALATDHVSHAPNAAKKLWPHVTTIICWPHASRAVRFPL